MNTSNSSSDNPACGNASRHSNVVVLALAQGLFTAAIAIDLTLTGLTGYELAPDKSLATLPFALITVAGAIATYFASTLMQKVGRRRGVCARGAYRFDRRIGLRMGGIPGFFLVVLHRDRGCRGFSGVRPVLPVGGYRLGTRRSQGPRYLVGACRRRDCRVARAFVSELEHRFAPCAVRRFVLDGRATRPCLCGIAVARVPGCASRAIGVARPRTVSP